MKTILASLCLLAVAAGCTTRTATLPDGRVLYKSARFATDENMKRVEFRTKAGDVFILEGYAGNQTDAIGIAVEAAVKAALASSTGGASALRSGPPAVPPGYKLVPVDDPSEPKLEVEPTSGQSMNAPFFPYKLPDPLPYMPTITPSSDALWMHRTPSGWEITK